MTVRQLIEKLQEMPKDAIVVNESCSQEVDIVEQITDKYCIEDECVNFAVGIV